VETIHPSENDFDRGFLDDTCSAEWSEVKRDAGGQALGVGLLSADELVDHVASQRHSLGHCCR